MAKLLLLGVFVVSCARHRSTEEGNARQLVEHATSARAAGVSAAPKDAAASDFALHNPHAYIPAQCYTKTRDESGRVHNPCYACHSASRAPNFVDDSAQQLGYSFPASARDNAFQNLFTDHSAATSALTDDAILHWVREDNYKTPQKTATIIPQRAGFAADAYFHFDAHGYDRAPNDEYSGWRAFAYYPFPGVFMPTNGSTDEVLIRLPEPFRENAAQHFDETIYSINFAVLEALIKQEDVAIDAADERSVGVDLDGDGQLGTARRVRFRFDASGKTTLSWVGQAKHELEAGNTQLAAGLYPEGTEFLHSVRYLDVAGARVDMAARLKELRYARKIGFIDATGSEQLALGETSERKLQPDALRALSIDRVKGAYTHLGWRYHGLIEAADGSLRAQSRDELATCVGCHTGLGVTTDGTFALARKLPSASFQRGWYDWSQRRLDALPEPKRANGEFEYSFYLETNGAGDDLRSNDEVLQKFFSAEGVPRPERISELHGNVGVLLWPSAKRALALDKAYRVLVAEQSFELGRDVTLGPIGNVFRSVTPDQPTFISEPVRTTWERRRGQKKACVSP